jgi:hypothetical protein
MSEHGQMNKSTERWGLIQKVIKSNDFKTIVEIGTWKGMGSTLAILSSKNDNTNFFSVESNLEFYEVAKKNLKSYEQKFNLIYGRVVEIDDVLNYSNNFILTNEQKSWLEEDINNMKFCDNILYSLPNKIDFLLLDGGEYSTYQEWKTLKDRSEYIALDDLKTIKSKKIFQEMVLDNSYSITEKTDEGNGFCIFKKINL